MIYLDYNATTPVDPEVAEEIQSVLINVYGNPSSTHKVGIEAKKAIEKARYQLASLIGAEPEEIIFTSGGTESNNLAIQGIARLLRSKGKHIITSSIEHPAVSEVCGFLSTEGFDITYIDVDESGRVDPEDITKTIRPDTILITIMHANNEVGTIQDIASISKIAKQHGITFHTDAAQSTGKIPIDVKELGIDLLSMAGHKFYAPKGVGALFIRSGTQLGKLMFGANHEQNLRPGTENVPLIAGLGKAAEIAIRDLAVYDSHTQSMCDLLYSLLKKEFPDIKRNGHPDYCLPNTLSISFPGIEANTLVSRLNKIAVSAGAACHADQVDVSKVLQAMSVPVRIAMGTIRFSTGKKTTDGEIRKAAEMIVSVVRQLGNKNVSHEKPAKTIRLTQYTHGLGCACKIEPKKLEAILQKLPKNQDPNVLVGHTSSDDASVYQLSEEVAIVQTLDFFTPIVDDPYDFGAIAASNALSDIYAMGARPLYAQSIVGFPEHILPMEVLEKILKGASDKAREAGIEIIGGHTIEDPEPKYGMVVTGVVNPKSFLTNSGAKPGDELIMTKPLGSGILATALKNGMLKKESIQRLTDVMSELNAKAAESMQKFRVHACTDITGFGFLGHLLEMSNGSKCDAVIRLDKIPIMKRVKSLAASGILPGGSKENLEYVIKNVSFENTSTIMQYVLSDAQTSGGLLIAVHPDDTEGLLELLHRNGVREACHIGHFDKPGAGMIRIVPG